MNPYGTLRDADTDKAIRDATATEAVASYDADIAGEGGVFPCDWRSEGGWHGEDSRCCYVTGADEAALVEYAKRHGIAFTLFE